jgi:hypothetical protein
MPTSSTSGIERISEDKRMLPGIQVTVTLLSLAAAASLPAQQTREQLDATSGMTVMTQTEALVFARPQPQYSRSARDYVYLGPVELNRQGQRSYHLWVGIGTTIDRGYLAPREPDPQTLYVSVNGELMEFPLQRWSTADLGLGQMTVYSPVVPVQLELVARVTLDQLRLLAVSDITEVLVKRTQDIPQRYARWDLKQPGWTAFVERAQGSQQQSALTAP